MRLGILFALCLSSLALAGSTSDVFAQGGGRWAAKTAMPSSRTEVAAAVLYLASDEAAFITGTAFIFDGGWTAGK